MYAGGGTVHVCSGHGHLCQEMPVVCVNSVSRGSCIAWVPVPSSSNGSSIDLEVALPDTLEGFCPTSR